MKQATALKILKSGQNVFLTGSAGTGKTHLLNQFIDFLKERKINPTVLAPTGIAASHLNGQTIHSFFALGIKDEIDDWYLDSLLQKKYLIDRFRKLKVLIIDEISMVSPEIFSSMDKILKAFKFSDQPFGGVQVILSGDFFQLPPVSKKTKTKIFAWQAPIWKELNLQTCYLQEKFRQDDDKLIKILDDIRSGKISKDSYNSLQERHQKDLEINFRPTKLYTHNIDVDKINNQELEKINNPLQKFFSENKGSQKNIEKIFKSSLVLEELNLKKEAVVIFIKNNFEEGYINGSIGKIVDFDKNDNLPIVEIFSGRQIKVDREDWVLENDNGKIIASVSQIPLRLAWAITVHKSQGMTLEVAEIDLTKTFEPGQGYVALSRIKNIQGLKLLGINKMALQVSPLILQIDERMKKASRRAEKNILEISTNDLTKQINCYIEKIGGCLDEKEIIKERKKIKKQPKVLVKNIKEPNYLQSKKIAEVVKNFSELLEKSSWGEETLIRHLLKIKNEDKNFDLEKFKPSIEIFKQVKKTVEKLKKENKKENFNKNGELKLKPIFLALGEKISYLDIKLALLFL